MGKYHDLYVQSDTLLLADIYEKIRNTCIKIYELDPAHFLSAPGLAWQACLKKTKINLELLTDIDLLLMFEEGIRGGMCQTIQRYAEANNKYLNNYNKNKASYLMYLDANNLYGWAMCKKLPIGEFEWIHPEDYKEEDIIKNYDDDDDVYGAILEVDIEYPKTLWGLHNDLPFLPTRKKIDNTEKSVTAIEDKKKIRGTHSHIKASIKSWIKNSTEYLN